MLPHDTIERIGNSPRLDAIAEPLGKLVKKLLPAGAAKDLLSGTWLGHQLHPLLTDVPIGSFTSATILDLVGGQRAQKAANLLAAVGIASVFPTAAAGLADWSDTYGYPKRVGTVHALANAVGTSLYGASIIARHRGSKTTATLLGLLGMSAMTAGGYLGGHLTLVRGVGVNNTFVEDPKKEWTATISDTELEHGGHTRVDIDGVPVLLDRTTGSITAISNHCTHAGGPLDEGEFATIDGRACVTCPWHQSVFSLDDGSVIHGPATVPERAWDVRVKNDRIEIRPR